MTNTYFTFGFDHPLHDIAVRIQAEDSETARDMMVAKFGYDWAFQYSEEERERCIDRHGKKVVDIAEVVAPAR